MKPSVDSPLTRAPRIRFASPSVEEGLLTTLTTPSNLSPSQIVGQCAEGSIAAHAALLGAQRTILTHQLDAGSWESVAATSVVDACRLVMSKPAFGVGRKEKPMEDTISGMISSLLQRYMPQPAGNDCDVIWAHQMQRVDICGLRKYTVDGHSGYEPRVLWEFGHVGNSSNKQCQIFGQVNNSDGFFHSRHQHLVLGVVVVIGESFQLRGYYKVQEPRNNGHEPITKLAVVDLFQGTWSVGDLSHLLFTLAQFIHRPSTDFGKLGGRSLPMRVNRNTVLIVPDAVTDARHVYKVFDYRHPSAITSRKYEANLRFLEEHGCRIDFSDRDRLLVVLRYDYIEGKHYPTHSAQVIALIDAVRNVHDQGYLHLDIRAANVIFTSAGRDDYGAQLIDFDYAGVSGVVRYPTFFNPNIEDGERHPNAIGEALADPQHDWFAVSKMLVLYRPLDESLLGLWAGVIDALAEGNFENARKRLTDALPFEFAPPGTRLLFQDDPVIYGTGSPKQRRNG